MESSKSDEKKISKCLRKIWNLKKSPKIKYISFEFEQQKKFEFATTTKSFQNSHFQKDFMVSEFF